MRRKLVVLLLCLKALSLLVLSCSQPQNNDQKQKSKPELAAEREKEEQKSRRESINKELGEIDERIRANPAIAEMANRHNAVIHWQEELRDLQKLYTTDIQSALARGDKRPLLLITSIDDVHKEKDKNLLEFELYMYEFERPVYFEIQCEPEQCSRIMRSSATSEDEYAIIAIISSVRKMRLNILALDDEIADIDLNSNKLLATGSCLDLLNVRVEDK